MEKFEERYDLALEEILAAWIEYAVRALQENLKKKKMVFSAELENSIKMRMTKVVDGAGAAQLDLKTYGRFRDMKRNTYSGPANFEAMLEWVKKIGIQRFKYIPGYDPAKRTVNRIPTTSLAMNRIAWGIAWGRFIKFNGRRKQWLNKYFYGPLQNVLIDSIIKATGRNTVSIITDQLNEGLLQP